MNIEKYNKYIISNMYTLENWVRIRGFKGIQLPNMLF